MRYISTRGKAPALAFDDVLLAGLAVDGGLYVPEAWPRFSADEMRSMRGLSYPELAMRVMSPLVGGRIGEADFARLVRDAYGDFGHRAVAPLRQHDANLWVQELFHGPTLAFKDVAMQLLGRLFDHVLKKRGERITIVGATSGDTGSAAIEACRDRDSIEVFILYPHERVSEVQRRQMTTVASANVRTIAIEGTFDDCQDLLKAMFNDNALRRELRLSAVNSINWARIMAQIVYYFHAGLSLGAPDRTVSFSVPSGNFGNVFAGYAAHAMGLPVESFVVASNRNDILYRFFERNDMSVAEVQPTLSPSMDIQVSSNFERLLFDMLARDGAALTRAMTDFRKSGRLTIDNAQWRNVSGLFHGHRVDDERTRRVIADVFAETGELIDPHTAVGIDAARARRGDASVPMVALATAHAAKFPDAVEAATGIRPDLPGRLADLYEREERITVLPNDLAAVSGFIRQHVGLRGAA
ncbi:MAG: threonine synthase [Alphaproteobacteria bacterium]|nr:threonine synthase [Alphaproteobacteria bacterium]